MRRYIQKHITKHIHKHPSPKKRDFLKRTISAQLHLVGLIAATIGLMVLLHFARLKLQDNHFWACLAFGLTSILVFAASTVYHFLTEGFIISNGLSKIMEDLDHTAIFLFIAGTYTPFILNVIDSPWDKILLILIWTVGVSGIFYVHFKTQLPLWAQHRFVYTGLFVLMGWTAVIRLGEAFQNLSHSGSLLLIAGGLSYTIGAVIYAFKWPDPFKDIFGFHEIWHIMVILGYSFHYFMILNFYRYL